MIQKDSPYYEVVNNKKDRRDYEKTHSVVKKHHISQIDKEGQYKGQLWLVIKNILAQVSQCISMTMAAFVLGLKL